MSFYLDHSDGSIFLFYYCNRTDCLHTSSSSHSVSVTRPSWIAMRPPPFCRTWTPTLSTPSPSRPSTPTSRRARTWWEGSVHVSKPSHPHRPPPSSQKQTSYFTLPDVTHIKIITLLFSQRLFLVLKAPEGMSHEKDRFLFIVMFMILCGMVTWTMKDSVVGSTLFLS